MTVLVGFDDSDAAARALERAAAEAGRSHERLVVLAVLEMPLDPRDPPQYGTAGDGTPDRGPFQAPPAITAVLDDARARLAGSGVTAEYAWAPGEPARLIASTAEQVGARMIVVGHHHHGFLSRLIGGDVAADVQRDAACEVVVVD